MKQKIVLAGLVCMVFLSFHSAAQHYSEGMKTTAVNPYYMAISDNMATNLIFPFAIKRAYWVSPSLDVQQIREVENILMVRASAKSFTPTNLSVVTSDGRFYSFILSYADYPSVLNVVFDRDTLMQVRAKIAANSVNDEVMEQTARTVLSSRNFVHRTAREQAIQLSLKGVYQRNQQMWFKLRVDNWSRVAFAADKIRFFVKDKRAAKRTAIQERELSPLYVTTYPQIDGMKNSYLLFAVPAFTIPKKQRLVIQLSEKNGGRSLSLFINHKALIRARLLR